MPKQKTHKGTANRVRVTKNKKVLRKKAGAGHLLSHKSAKRRRSLRKGGTCEGAMRRRIIKLVSS